MVGDSMIDAAICDDDTVTVSKMDSADHGDIVAALLGDAATVQVLRQQDGRVWLEPRNPSDDPTPGDDTRALRSSAAASVSCAFSDHEDL
ncbi:LexA family protein [Streptomyces sp. NPDC001480]|uniref:LexA family protein n=1 Tax=Streptomyces sp. NPDC001480 TaxID=3364577 RepID=UPI00368960BD